MAANFAMTVRRLHTYIGVFIAPSVLFFAFTGSMQLYSLHESHDGYKAPVLIRSLAAIHKDQTYVPPPERDHGAAGGPPDAKPHGPPPPDDAPPIHTLILKAFYLGVAVCLMGSTLAGVWMALTFSRRKPLIWALLVLGALTPIAILAV